MSLKTEADKYREEAERCIQNAIVKFAHVVSNNVEGWGQYNKQYQERVKTALEKLREARTELETY